MISPYPIGGAASQTATGGVPSRVRAQTRGGGPKGLLYHQLQQRVHVHIQGEGLVCTDGWNCDSVCNVLYVTTMYSCRFSFRYGLSLVHKAICVS